MRGRKIINEFFKIVHNYYTLGIADFNSDVDSNLYSFDEIIDEFKLIPAFNNLSRVKHLINIFTEGSFNPDFLDEHVNSPYRKIEIIKFTESAYNKRNRAFFYFDNDFGYFSFKKTFEGNHHLNNFLHQVAAISNIQQYVISSIALNQRNKITEMLDVFEDGNKNIGLLLQKNNHRTQSVNIYSFIYFKYLSNGGVVEVENRLKYSISNSFNPNFIKANSYSQFFEIYDVLNEVNQSKDIISRYLKVYHILEYLSYRVKLVEIEVRARERKTFIREITSFKKENEETYIIDCFKKVFLGEMPAIKTKLGFNTSLKSYIEKQFGISASSYNSPEYLPKLIYRLRNSIVHNKESEFHITISNPEEYRQIISLTKKLINQLEILFLSGMNIPKPQISYAHPVIKLY